MPGVFVSRKGLPEPVNASTGLTPTQLGALREKIKATVEKNLSTAEQVLSGDVKWSPQQVKLFGMMLDKIVPNISISAHVGQPSETNPRKMSREQLEAAATELSQRIADERTDEVRRELGVTIEGSFKEVKR